MKIYTKLVLIIFCCSITAFGQVTLPHYEPFDYTIGEGLQTQTGWEALNSGDDIIIRTGNLSLDGFSAPTFNRISFDGSGIDAGKLFTPQTNGTVFYSFFLNVNNLGSLNTTGSYFTGFTSSTSTEFGATVWIRKRGDGYQLGLNPRSSEIANTVWSNDTLLINRTTFIVISYQIVSGLQNDLVSLWQNPISTSFGGTAPNPTLTAVNSQTDLSNLNRILIRQDAVNSTPFIEMDELRIATSWANVTPAISGLPLITVNPSGLINLNYFFGSGPAIAQSYNLTGTNLNGSDVMVIAPTDYEISSNSGVTWNSSLTFSEYGSSLNQLISVRLKADLITNNYNYEYVKNSGGGVSSISINCSGTVNPLPPQQLLEENFSYGSGQLTDAPGGSGTNVSGGNWSSVSGSGNYINVVDGNLLYTSYPSSSIGRSISIISSISSSEDVRRNFSDISSEKIYASFLVNILNTTGLDETEGNYFIHFTNIGGTGSGFHARLYIRAQGSNIQFGIRARSDNTTSWAPALYNTGTTNLIVISYDIVSGDDNNIAILWINPNLSGLEPIADATSTNQISTQADPDGIDALGIRQDYTGNSTTPNAIIDGIRVAPTWSNAPLPVELTSFSASVVGNAVKLNWKTETEVNNYGFEVERKVGSLQSTVSNPSTDETGYEKIGFVNGSGNSNSPKSYSFEDKVVTAGKYSYRLKQIDNDGKYEYSQIVEVDLGLPTKFELSQNYPNPFNPITKIRYSIPTPSASSPLAKGRNEVGFVSLKVYDILGNEVATLVNEEQQAGVYEVGFNPNGLASGIYFYKLQSGSFVQTRKMTLLK